jgi:hypothetical protein
MIRPYISSVILSCITFSVSASDMRNFNEQLMASINNGSVEIRTDRPLQISPEIAEMMKQINNADLQFEKPLLVFTDEEILLNDSKKLNEVLSVSSATITSR